MISKKLSILLGTVVGLAAISIFAINYSNGGSLQGKLARKSGALESGNAPWWCKPEPQAGVNGNDNPNVPPDKSKDGGDSSSGSSSSPGSKGGSTKFDPKKSKFIGDPTGGSAGKFGISNPKNAWKYEKLPILKGSGGKGGSNGGGTPGTPKVDPTKAKIKNYYECSCYASFFTIPEINYSFQCPSPGEKNVDEAQDSKGLIHEITSFKPSADACQKTPKKNETVTIGHYCGCNETSFYEPVTEKTYECPKPGLTKYFGDGKPYKFQFSTQPESECKEKWKCPKGYEWDWPKIKDDCDKEKANECSGKELYKIDGDASAVCKAFVADQMDLKCEDLEKCKETMKLFSAGVMTSELLKKNLLSPDVCAAIYGDKDSSPIWK